MADSDTLSEAEFYEKAFSRNIGLTTPEEQKKLKNARVAIAGLGGVGGIHMISLVRLGIGNFHITDFDDFSIENLNRQAGADTGSFGQPKAATMERKAREVNPYISVKVFPEGINTQNVDEFLEGVDVVLDGIDFFNIDTRLLLYKRAREKGIHVISAGPIGFGATLLVFDPEGMAFEDYLDIKEGMPEDEKLMRFGLGIVPALLQRKYFKPEAVNFKTHKAPSTGMGTLFCAGLASCEVLKIILKRGKIDAVPVSMQFDPYIKAYKRINVRWGNKGPLQRLKMWILRRQLKKAGGM